MKGFAKAKGHVRLKETSARRLVLEWLENRDIGPMNLSKLLDFVTLNILSAVLYARLKVTT